MSKNEEGVMIHQTPAEESTLASEVWSQGYGRVAAEKTVYPDLPPPEKHNYKTRLIYWLKKCGPVKIKRGTTTSHRTFHERRTSLFRIFKLLREEGGFKIDDPANLDARHVRFLFQHWEQRRRLHKDGLPGGLAAGSVEQLVSILRTFLTWIGQPQLIDFGDFTIPDAVSRVRAADRDKTWAAAGIDEIDAIARAWEEAPWVGVGLLVQLAFGLRRKEAVMFIPEVAYRPGESFVHINMVRSARSRSRRISPGAKSARPRMIPVQAEWECEVLEFAREFVGNQAGAYRHLGGRSTLLASLRYYYRVLDSIGISRDKSGGSSHSLRVSRSIRGLNRQGVEAPVRGGDLTVLDSKTRDRVLRCLAEDLGHSRPSISASYYGAVHNKGDIKEVDPAAVDAVIAPRIAQLLEKFRADLKMMRKLDRAARAYDRALREE